MFRATFLVFFLLFGAVFSKITFFQYFLNHGSHTALGHPHKEPDADSIRAHEEVRRRCGPRVAKMKRDRLALRRRDDSVDADSGDTVYKINAKAPKYNKIKDWTNILTPETSRGPYFLPRSQTLRQDIREDEPGVPLSLEIGVIDVNTCDPLDSVLVDIWVGLQRKH